MANDENLIVSLRDRTPNERRESARKAGKASGKARREKRTLQEIAKTLLSMPMDDKELEAVEYLKGYKGKNVSAGEAALLVQMQKAIQEADGKAFMIVRDTAGEQPVQRVEVNSDIAAAEAALADMIKEMDDAETDQ